MYIPENLPHLNVHSFKKVKEFNEANALMIREFEIATLIQIYLKAEKERMMQKAKQTREQQNVYRDQSDTERSTVSKKRSKHNKGK